MNHRKNAVETIVFLSLSTLSSAWIPHHLSPRLVSLHPSSTRTRRLMAGPFFGPEEEFTCPDEEECEIDWDKMPEFTSDEEVEDERDLDMQPPPSYGSLADASFGTGRVRLEMNWQLEECETDEDSCTDFCPECAGSGRQPCRFCRGTGIVTFGKDFRPCLICSNAVVSGQEDCSSCSGTGQIAPWASTMEEHLQAKKDEEEKQTM